MNSASFNMTAVRDRVMFLRRILNFDQTTSLLRVGQPTQGIRAAIQYVTIMICTYISILVLLIVAD